MFNLSPGACENIMPSIKVKENEDIEIALRRFKRACEKAGVLSEVRRRVAYEKPTEIRKRKSAAAVKRHLKKLQRELPQPRDPRDRSRSGRGGKK